MKLVIFGLSVSSSWGNGHATLWRGLIGALGDLGHTVVFFERDVPYYAAHRDLDRLERGTLILYNEWRYARSLAAAHLASADVAIVTSYCPDAIAAAAELLDAAPPLSVFYDLDTPVTLAHLRAGRDVPYIGPRGLADFDLTLSYTGGAALTELRRELRARRAEPLYGSVDPAIHRPVPASDRYRADLSYLGTYATDRQAALEALLVAPARSLPQQRFVIGGAQYPDDFPWTDNIYFVRHLPPSEHPGFFASSRLTLNVTRAPMAQLGYCPSGRLFEAAACGAPMVTDAWEGLDAFFTPAEEILVATHPGDVVDALGADDAELARMARAARERVLAEHTSERRAEQLVGLLDGALSARA